jgi:metal-responsive CopG/Arc/MetJ family transcriptional regulator
MKDVVQIGLKENAEIVKEIDRIAEEEGCDRSAIIRRIIREKLRIRSNDHV